MWKLMLLGLGMFHHHHLMHHRLQTQRNDVAVDPVMQTERPVSSMEADKVNAADAPSSSGGKVVYQQQKGVL